MDHSISVAEAGNTVDDPNRRTLCSVTEGSTDPKREGDTEIPEDCFHVRDSSKTAVIPLVTKPSRFQPSFLKADSFEAIHFLVLCIA